ncbi:phage baseplate assembly protein V [Caballeronia cordobensis]|uniref:phage baseplate assembly protein V n=1 Tax=Caballeronia cordobensis TaxID=1353886 RepID=UPI00045EEAD8|nr:phage baseplate assembly protein V [Caballeronia cordobensis]BAO90267.1 putative membrane protein [Burkholderia sp. RPE67]
MPNDMMFGLLQDVQPLTPDKKVYGVAIGTVVNNVDSTGQARVQLMLPWLPGYQPWARLATLMAGMARGTYFVPMVGDEVLVAFNHGDVREPFVVGALWNTLDRPPSLSPTDAVTRRLVRSPLGHELEFDDALQTVTLKSNLLSKVTLAADKAEISTPTASVTVGKLGDVTITAKTRLTLDAPVIEIKAKASLTVQSQGVATLKASGACVVQGSVVKIN